MEKETSNETLNLIENRKSVRKYSKKRIGNKDIDHIIDAAMRAPTAGNQMLYSIIEVEDQDLKDKLVHSCDDQPFIAKAPLVLLFLADYQRIFDLYVASGALEFGTAEGIVSRKPEVGDLMLAVCDALIAAQTSVIAAESLGIGSCYIGDVLENYEIHREMFKLPDYVFPITILCFGYPLENYSDKPVSPRFPKGYIHFKNNYKRFNDADFKKMVLPLEETYYTEGKFSGNAENLGQHLYSKKFTADFTVELNRSVRKALEAWSPGI